MSRSEDQLRLAGVVQEAQRRGEPHAVAHREVLDAQVRQPSIRHRDQRAIGVRICVDRMPIRSTFPVKSSMRTKAPRGTADPPRAKSNRTGSR
jgi:hypothetical protein